MKTLRDDTGFARLLSWLAGAVCRRPGWFVWPQVLLVGLSLFYTLSELQFDTSRNNLVGANKKYHQNFLRFKKEFPTQDDLVVVVESEDPEKNRQFIERLGARIEAARVHVPAPDGSGRTIETNLFNHIFYKGDLKLLGSKALLFVSEEELAQLRDQLRDYRPFLDEFARTTNLVSLFEMINRQFRQAGSQTQAQNEQLVRMIPALERIVTQATASLRRSGVPPSPGVFALFGDGETAAQSIYLTFGGGGRIWIATAQALSEELNGEAVERMRQLVAQTRAEVPGLNVGLTGEPVLERDEMRQSQKDTALASVVALVLTALIFIYGYQETGRPLKATLCLVVGLAYTLGFGTLTVGHLNLLTITFVPILIGLGIDFGVHLVTRYEEELRHGLAETEALRRAMVFTGQGIFTGAFTTAGAFLAMTLTDFKGIQEMGLICGAGLLICLIPMLTLLPVLLLRGRQNVLDHQLALRPDPRARIEQLWLRRPRTVFGLTAALCGLALVSARQVHFDYNLLNMQSEGLPAVVFEEKLIQAAASGPAGATNGSGRSVLFAAVITDSLQQALAVEERVRSLPSVGEVDSLARYLTENQEQKLRLISQIKETLGALHFAPADTGPVDIPELSRTLWSLNGYVGLAREEARAEAPEVAAQLDALHRAVEELRVELFAGKPREQAERGARLRSYQQALFADFRETFTALQQQDDRERLRIEDLPPALRDRFIGVTGKFLVQVYPRHNVWERANQIEFIGQLRQALDPHNTGSPVITGTPVQLLEYTTLLKRSYEEAALYALGAVALLVLVHFQSVPAVLLALCPVAVGSLWLVGLMGWRGIPFNPANIMTLPLVVGIGVTNGIHILNRFAEERSPGILARSTGKAVLVSGLTTIAGFGSLVLAQHRGIASLGFVMGVGVATCMIAGLTFLPALLAWVHRDTKQPSADNARSTLGREEPR